MGICGTDKRCHGCINKDENKTESSSKNVSAQSRAAGHRIPSWHVAIAVLQNFAGKFVKGVWDLS